MSNFSKQLGAQYVKSAGIGSLIAKGVKGLGRMAPRVGARAEQAVSKIRFNQPNAFFNGGGGGPGAARAVTGPSWFNRVGNSIRDGTNFGSEVSSRAMPEGASMFNQGLHQASNIFNKSVGGAVGGISRGMANSNIPGISAMGRTIEPWAGAMGRNATPMAIGGAVMNHAGNTNYNELMDEANGALDERDQYISQLLQQQQQQSSQAPSGGGIGQWLSQYL